MCSLYICFGCTRLYITRDARELRPAGLHGAVVHARASARGRAEADVHGMGTPTRGGFRKKRRGQFAHSYASDALLPSVRHASVVQGRRSLRIDLREGNPSRSCTRNHQAMCSTYAAAQARNN